MQGHVEGARGGIVMHAEPSLDGPDYAQGFAPDPYFWADRARVIETGASVSEVAGEYDDVPEEAFRLVGPIEEAVEKAKTMA